MFVADDKDDVTLPLSVQTERENEVVQQPEQATRLRDKQRRAADRETHWKTRLHVKHPTHQQQGHGIVAIAAGRSPPARSNNLLTRGTFTGICRLTFAV